jgi:hypothetical protein
VGHKKNGIFTPFNDADPLYINVFENNQGGRAAEIEKETKQKIYRITKIAVKVTKINVLA